MSRGVRLGLWCLALFLVLFPLTVGKPGLPPTLKADEPAYYLMALSLAHDGDLVCQPEDLARLEAEYPFLPTHNLILMSRDGWRTVYYGKPFVYSLVAAPAARWFGANGLVAVNMALFLAMVAMGISTLRRTNAPAPAVLFAGGFFFLSSAFAYVFWLQPEVFNMASVMTSLWLVLGPGRGEDDDAGATASPWRILLSGAVLALGAYNKPVLAAMALPCLVALWRGRDLKKIALWGAGFAAAGVLLVAISTGLTGQASAYLGAQRSGVQVVDPGVAPIEPVDLPRGTPPSTANSWTWIFRVPDLDPGEVARDVGYFLWGRHTGLFLYMPFALLSLVLFLVDGWRSATRWATLLALVTVAAFFLLWIPFNWHGGGGFVGNRYFVNVYPAFLFLVARIRPRAILPVGYALAGLFVGPIVFTPFGAPVPFPTLQAHVRSGLFRYFPVELPMLTKIPGYQGTNQLGVRFVGRKDVFRRQGEEMWVQGGAEAEIWVRSRAPLARFVFGVRSEAPVNQVRLELAGSGGTLIFDADGPRFQFLALEPEGPTRVLHERDGTEYLYRFLVHPRAGRIPAEQIEKVDGRFYLGAALVFFGPGDPRRHELYELAWGDSVVPPIMEAGATVSIVTRVTNRSRDTWPSEGPAQVKLAYHWLDAAGVEVVRDGERSPLPYDVPPGGSLEAAQGIRAPATAGSYILELDPVLEHVAWFSGRNGNDTARFPVEVVPPAPPPEPVAQEAE